MSAYRKLILTIYFTITFECLEFTSIHGFIDPKHPNDPILVLPKMKLRQGTEGIFERFLRKFLDLLSTTFPERKLTRYCRVLSRHLVVMGYKHTDRLARHLKYMSRKYRDDLRNDFKKYRQELDKKLPRRTEFLNAMNEIFTLRENQLFDDYIYELENYGNEVKLHIDYETRKLLDDVIVGNILITSQANQKDLYTKMRHAVTEYLKGQ